MKNEWFVICLFCLYFNVMFEFNYNENQDEMKMKGKSVWVCGSLGFKRLKKEQQDGQITMMIMLINMTNTDTDLIAALMTKLDFGSHFCKRKPNDDDYITTFKIQVK